MHFYTSQPANSQLAILALSLSRKGHQVRLFPLTDLPPTMPVRLGPLRVEQEELLTSLAFTNWGLALLNNGTWQPDSDLQANLLRDKAALETRLTEINQLLAGQQGGQADG